jgi:hypothetical protein
MKIQSSPAYHPRAARRGSAVVVLLVLISFLVVLAVANAVTLRNLRKRMNILEQRQTQRLASSSTNSFRAASPARNQSPLP